MDQEAIRRAIKERYGGLADRAAGDASLMLIETAAGDACCDDACCTPAEMTEAEKAFVKGLYAEDEVAGLPPGAIESAAGCGNPTAIAEIAAGETVLDLGSGGGIDCFLASRQTGPAGRVIGVDITQKMIDLARRNAAELGVPNAEFRLGEIEDLPVESGTVDVIISNCVINLSTDKARTLQEAFRVLKPGGRLRISDMVWRAIRPEGADSLEEWAGCIAGASVLPDLLTQLQSAGFVDARADAVRDLPGYTGLASALISAEKPA